MAAAPDQQPCHAVGHPAPVGTPWPPHSKPCFVPSIQAQSGLAKLESLSLGSNVSCLLGIGKAAHGIYFMGCFLLSQLWSCVLQPPCK